MVKKFEKLRDKMSEESKERANMIRKKLELKVKCEKDRDLETELLESIGHIQIGQYEEL